ncbi:MAG: thioredoxin family protein [Leptospira sp.]|nr:thioredoxin family protein [Leptospira sp.]
MKINTVSNSKDIFTKALTNIMIIFSLFSIILLTNCKSDLDENQASLELYAQAVPLAKESGQKILLIFGADWCGDCVSLRERFRENEQIGKLLLENYLVIHIDVGRFDRNLIFAEKFGSPEKKGIPALAIIDPTQDEKVLATTKGGEFSSARSMSDAAIYEYLKRFTN